MTDMSLFSAPQAALLAQCHRRSALADAADTVRDVLNTNGAFTAGPAHMAGSPHAPAAEFTVIHKGTRYRIVMNHAMAEINAPTNE